MLHEANAPVGWAEALEKGRIVHFARCPIELPPPGDQEFLRDGLAPWLRKKNVSFYPTAGKLTGMRAPAALVDRARAILAAHALRVRIFLDSSMPDFTRGMIACSSSFRPLQDECRGLSPHASNDRIHV